MRHDLGTFPGSAATRRSQEPDFPAEALICLGVFLTALILAAGASVAPMVV